MQKKSVKILHLSRETLHDMSAAIVGGAWSQSSCPRNKICETDEVTQSCVNC